MHFTCYRAENCIDLRGMACDEATCVMTCRKLFYGASQVKNKSAITLFLAGIILAMATPLSTLPRTGARRRIQKLVYLSHSYLLLLRSRQIFGCCETICSLHSVAYYCQYCAETQLFPLERRRESHETVRRATKFARRTGLLTSMPAAGILHCHWERAEMATTAAAFRSNIKKMVWPLLALNWSICKMSQ